MQLILFYLFIAAPLACQARATIVNSGEILNDMIEKRSELANMLDRGLYEQSIAKAEGMIKIMNEIIDNTYNYTYKINKTETDLDGERKLYTTLLADVGYGRYFALEKMARYPEAFVSMLRIRRICITYEVCPLKTTDKKIALLEELAQYLTDVELLQLQGKPLTLDEVKKAYHKLLLVVHPDKNPQLDAESKKRLADLFSKISSAYVRLKKVHNILPHSSNI